MRKEQNGVRYFETLQPRFKFDTSGYEFGETGYKIPLVMALTFVLKPQQHVPLKFQSLSLLLRDREAHPKRAAAAFAAIFIKGLHL